LINHAFQGVAMQEELQVEQELNNEQENHLEQQEQEQVDYVEQEKKLRAEKNFQALRLAKENAEKERDAYYKKLQEIEQSQKSVKKASLRDDDLVEGQHLNELKQELESYKREMHQATVENKIKTTFPDFDAVVNNDTVAQLKAAYPELAATLSASNDLYNTAASAYTMIKKLGIYDGNDYNVNKSAVMKNFSKPRSVSSVSPQQGDSPLTQANAFANGLTPELKQKLYQEMIAARRGV